MNYGAVFSPEWLMEKVPSRAMSQQNSGMDWHPQKDTR